MSTKKRSPLGRGLSNLISGADDAKVVVQSHPNYQELSLDKIIFNPNQPRKHINTKELQELADTLQSVGLIEPIVVRRVGQEEIYQIIAGERRFRAAKLAGFKKIPSILKQATDLQALEIGIIENIQREELNPVEEARAYEYWMNITKQKSDVLAKKLGKDRSTVKNLTRILKLPDEVLELIGKKQLNVGQARPLLSIGDSNQLKKLATKICKEGWTARRVEDEVALLTEGKRKAKTKKDKDANIIHLERNLRVKLSARVSVQHKKNGGGTISIHYGNLNDLERLLSLLEVK